MSGIEAATELRKRHGIQFKVYLLTGNAVIKSQDPELESIIDGVLTKPCSKNDLKSIMAEHLKDSCSQSNCKD